MIAIIICLNHSGNPFVVKCYPDAANVCELFPCAEPKIFSEIKYIIVGTRCGGGSQGGIYHFGVAPKQETGGFQAG